VGSLVDSGESVVEETQIATKSQTGPSDKEVLGLVDTKDSRMREPENIPPLQREADWVISPSYGMIPLDFLVRGETHPCPYLPGRDACEDVFKAIDFPPELYHDFMNYGFRRSGVLFYRTACPGCFECKPIRVIADKYKPSKGQRRILRKNQDIAIKIGAPRFSKEKSRLYSDYLEWQHSRPEEEASSLRTTLYRSSVHTLEFEYRLDSRLVAVGIVDLCSRSLSSVYAFYDPDCASRSLGTFSAIREILFCQERGIPYYYLGFLVAACPSMMYKSRFKPHEVLDGSLKWAPPLPV
jgi:leucyl-tRNA---protein transferase